MINARDKRFTGKAACDGLPGRKRNECCRTHPHMAWARITLLLLISLTTLVGCSDGESLGRTYGRRGGTVGRDSVNGTAVLAKMFQKAGHRVVTKRQLSPSVHEADVLVWFPDNFKAPSEEVTNWLESWLDEKDGGIVIYVDRNFDAAIPYWDAVIPGATGSVAAEMGVRRDRHVDDFGNKRIGSQETAEFRWYQYDATVPRRKVTTLSGPWSDGIDVSQIEMELWGKIEPGPYEYDDREVLLASGEDPLVTRIEFSHDEDTESDEDEDDEHVEYYEAYDYIDKSNWSASELILVSNGSFLLNEPLVNHENRKLAGKLIDRCAGKTTVVFLESDFFGLPVRDTDPPPNVPSVLMIFTVWPLNIILVHLAVVGVVFCFARWPIFGRARHEKAASTSDFGHHVSALGSMLARTENRSYAHHQIGVYRQSYKGETAAIDSESDESRPLPPPG